MNFFKKLNFFLFISMTLVLLGCSDADMTGQINKALSKRPAPTVEVETFISEHIEPNSQFVEGMYVRNSHIIDGDSTLSLDLNYYFSNGSLTIKGTMEGVTSYVFPYGANIYGESNYALHDGVITLTNVKGHGFFFPEYGIPYEIGVDGIIVIYEFSQEGPIQKSFLTPLSK